MFVFLFFAILIVAVTIFGFVMQVPTVTTYETVSTVYDDFDDDDDVIVEEVIIIED